MDISKLTIKQTVSGIKSKKFSSVELTKEYLEEIKKRNKKINAFITVCEKEAIESAKKADALATQGSSLPLLGVPVGLKDLFLTKGIRTTASSKVLENYIPQYNATVVSRIKNAGAVILGKLNCDAWAHGSSGENSDFGPTKNPWNEEYVPGGSSSGSAASVAANMCMASTGTDTGGSIRLPASFCNVVGLKPTYGRVSRYGIIAMASSLDSIGHFTKTVEDSAIFLNVTAGHDNKDATTPEKAFNDFTDDLNKSVKGLKIGIPKEYFSQGLSSEVKNTIEKVINFYKKEGAELIEISLPHTEYAIACYYIIQPSEVSSNLARYDGLRYGKERSFFSPEAKRRIMLGTFTLSSGYYDAYYKKAMKVRTMIIRDFENAFKTADVILTPVSPTLPWKIGEKANDPLKMYLSDLYTVTANLAGIPGISVPAGFVNGLPVGFQLLGPAFSEHTLFKAANAYERSVNEL